LNCKLNVWQSNKILTFVKEENTIISLKKKKKKFFTKTEIFDYCFKFVYARPYIDGISTHSEQQVTVDGHNGQNAKYFLKRKEKIKAKI
jgi:hypothetical protein